jgi:hypothetical protein
VAIKASVFIEIWQAVESDYQKCAVQGLHKASPGQMRAPLLRLADPLEQFIVSGWYLLIGVGAAEGFSGSDCRELDAGPAGRCVLCGAVARQEKHCHHPVEVIKTCL